MFSMLRRTFDDQGDPEEGLCYTTFATKVQPGPNRRRIVAGCFQELLFLKTKGLVDLRQQTPYGDIWITKTERFDSRVPSQSQPLTRGSAVETEDE